MQIHTTSQSSPMQAYNQAINDLDKELNHLKSVFEVSISYSISISTIHLLGVCCFGDSRLSLWNEGDIKENLNSCDC